MSTGKSFYIGELKVSSPHISHHFSVSFIPFTFSSLLFDSLLFILFSSFSSRTTSLFFSLIIFPSIIFSLSPLLSPLFVFFFLAVLTALQLHHHFCPFISHTESTSQKSHPTHRTLPLYSILIIAPHRAPHPTALHLIFFPLLTISPAAATLSSIGYGPSFEAAELRTFLTYYSTCHVVPFIFLQGQSCTIPFPSFSSSSFFFFSSSFLFFLSFSFSFSCLPYSANCIVT